MSLDLPVPAPAPAGVDPEIVLVRRFDLDQALVVPRLVYLAEGEEVTIGRTDIDSYIIVGPDGAEVIHRLELGHTPRHTADWYHSAYGETLDIEDVVQALVESRLVESRLVESRLVESRLVESRLVDDRGPGGEAGPASQVRWQRLGLVVFSVPSAILYAGLISWAVLATIRRPDLLPSYRHVFFTGYYSVIELTLFLAAVPQLLLHEAFHSLAGRRLGLRTRLSIGRRLYFVVLETSMDGLVAVPKARRYLPILAGLLADLLVVSTLTVIADLTRAPGGSFGDVGRVALAVALAVWLRILWQFSFYLRTDIYVLVVTVLGCGDLHAVGKQRIRQQVDRLLRRPGRITDPANWLPADAKASRWYAWLIVAGYALSLAMLVLAAGPIAIRIFVGVLGRFVGGGPVSAAELADSVAMTAFFVMQLAAAGWLLIRDRHRRLVR